MTAVDLCVNCYERTYRAVLAPGFFPTLVKEHSYRFSRRATIINNVHDRADAEVRAQRLKRAGELDAWFFVEDHVEDALRRTGLTTADIARAPYFTGRYCACALLHRLGLGVGNDPGARLARAL
jgi:hypothetical protein